MSRRHNIITVHHGNPNNPKLTLHLSQHNSNHPIGVRGLRSHTQIILASNSIKYPEFLVNILSRLPICTTTALDKIPLPLMLTSIILFDIIFEATLGPTLIIVTRCGNQTERLNSGLRITSTASGISIYPKHHGLSEFPSTPILDPSITQLLIQRLYMTSLHNSLYGKMTLLWPPPLTTQSTHRSLYRRLYSPCSRITKTRGLQHTTNYSDTQPPDRIRSIPFSYAFLMRNNHNQFNLSTPDRPKITYRIFFCQLHSTCYCSYSHPDSLKYVGATALTITHGLTSSILFCLANSNYERQQISNICKKYCLMRFYYQPSSNNPYINRFFKYLLLCLTTMLILVAANNLFQLFIAIEGPTPVSALLHSSTIVVAGVFLLIRFYPLTENNKLIQAIVLCLGALTTLFTPVCALTQNDIKKSHTIHMIWIHYSQPERQTRYSKNRRPIQGYMYLSPQQPLISAVYSTRIVFFTRLGQPHFSPLTSINENNPLLINSIKRLLIGSQHPPNHSPPSNHTLTSRTNGILGFILALNINLNTEDLKFIYPSNTLTSSSLLGYFPTIMHRLPPHLNLSMSQKSASSLLDLIRLENILPKTTSLIQLKFPKLISSKEVLIRLYFLSFLATLTFSTLSFNYQEMKDTSRKNNMFAQFRKNERDKQKLIDTVAKQLRGLISQHS
ncbi:hypothetical protein EI555_019366 [Monodon monoceros]|uniref:NADH-ubiquinone oxidoreductase chain 4 n=1 Tax=Monodon monoceros TaxID=40151 RepID=A0A4U1EQL5_MONMO|nr:hypothetical protein EI555_019366 [Monodon monoceros]